MLSKSLSYKSAGVNIEAADNLVKQIKGMAAKTQRPEVIGGIGGFGGLFALPMDRFKEPVLVSGTDGVGTKLKLAVQTGIHNTIGIDLVAMCVNDVVVSGAEPLFFLDYYATGRLDVSQAADVVSGIVKGCELAGATLLGGETAEMPGMYTNKDYDLAGFCVGVVEKANIINGQKVEAGDALIGLPSSGPHSNGFSLIRKILSMTHTMLSMPFENKTIGEILLEPTKIYVKPLLKLFEQIPVRAAAHITGGGIIENLPRVLPAGTQAVLHKSTWQRQEIFEWLQEHGNLSDEEMYRTFNCGLGMIVCVPRESLEDALKLLREEGQTALSIGEIVSVTPGDPQVVIV